MDAVKWRKESDVNRVPERDVWEAHQKTRPAQQKSPPKSSPAPKIWTQMRT